LKLVTESNNRTGEQGGNVSLMSWYLNMLKILKDHPICIPVTTKRCCQHNNCGQCGVGAGIKTASTSSPSSSETEIKATPSIEAKQTHLPVRLEESFNHDFAYTIGLTWFKSNSDHKSNVPSTRINAYDLIVVAPQRVSTGVLGIVKTRLWCNELILDDYVDKLVDSEDKKTKSLRIWKDVKNEINVGLMFRTVAAHNANICCMSQVENISTLLIAYNIPATSLPMPRYVQILVPDVNNVFPTDPTYSYLYQPLI
jgi:hypothetical protein